MKFEPLVGLVSDVEQVNPASLGRPWFTYLDIAAVDNGAKRLVAPQRIASGRAPSRARQVVHGNDVIVSTVRPNLNAVALVPEELGGEIASTGFCVLRSRLDNLWPQYLFYFTQSRPFIESLVKVATGATYPAVTDDDILATRIPLPELPHQQQIARRLEQADRLRRARLYALELTDTILPAIFHRSFVGGSSGQTGLLGEHLEAIEGGVNFTPVAEGSRASAWRVLKVSAVSWDDFLADESKPIAPSESFDDALIVRVGDLLMSRANTPELVGAAVRVRTPPPKVLPPDKVWRLKFAPGSSLLPDFVLFALRSRGVRHEIKVRATGTSGSMKNISKDDVRELRLPIPPLAAQERFVVLVEQVERLRTVQREALRQAEHIFASLLNSAFGG